MAFKDINNMRRKLVLKRTKPTSVFCQRKEQRCYSSRQKKKPKTKHGSIQRLQKTSSKTGKQPEGKKKSNKSNKTISTNMYLTTCVPMAMSEMTLYPKVQTVKETFYVLQA